MSGSLRKNFFERALISLIEKVYISILSTRGMAFRAPYTFVLWCIIFLCLLFATMVDIEKLTAKDCDIIGTVLLRAGLWRASRQYLEKGFAFVENDKKNPMYAFFASALALVFQKKGCVWRADAYAMKAESFFDRWDKRNDEAGRLEWMRVAYNLAEFFKNSGNERAERKYCSLTKQLSKSARMREYVKKKFDAVCTGGTGK